MKVFLVARIIAKIVYEIFTTNKISAPHNYIDTQDP